MDPRVAQHARLLVEYCLDAQAGQNVVVNVEEAGLALADAVVGELGRHGAHPIVVLNSGEASRAWYRVVPDAELDREPTHLRALYEGADAILSIKSTSNTRSTADIPSEKSARRGRAMQQLQEVRMSKRWCLTMHPTHALAQEADMSLHEFEDILYGSILRDWQAFGAEMRQLKERVADRSMIHIVNQGTNLHVPVGGRSWVVSDGKRNMPSGEVFTAPLEDQVEGHVTFDVPVVVRGRLVAGVRLEFSKGEVVAWTADRGADVVEELLSTDPGAKRLGELGLGCNRGIPKPTKNILLDEKLGGTIHLALGRAYTECGGVNQSAIHVDLISTMGPGSFIEADGQRVQEDGWWFYEERP